MSLFEELGIDIVFTALQHTYRNRGHIRGTRHDSSGPLYILTGGAGNRPGESGKDVIKIDGTRDILTARLIQSVAA